MKEYFNKIKELIKINKYNEITSNTNEISSGIYLIYIDCFTDENIIPIYIGQTKNFQERYEQHYKELLSLNRFSYDYYKYLFFYHENKEGSFYAGRFKSCKMFKFMIEHNLTLKSWHMIWVEKSLNNNLDELEQKYFNEYKPAFFGFNQCNSTIEFYKYFNSFNNDITLSDLLGYIYADLIDFNQYIDYGYSKFNLLYAFPIIGVKQLKVISQDDINYKNKIISLLEDLICNYFSKEYIDMLENYNDLRNKCIHYNSKLFEMKNILVKDIDKLIKDNSIRKKELKQWLLNYILSDTINVDPQIIGFLKNKKYKKIVLEFINDKRKFYTKDYNKINKLFIRYDKKFKNNKDLILNYEDNILKQIFPIQYKNFPLNDNIIESLIFNENENKNYCFISIILTNNGRKNRVDILTISYYIKNALETIQSVGNIIDSETINEINNNNIKYVEKHEKHFSKDSPYKPVALNKSSNISNDNLIDLEAELLSGINDYTLSYCEPTNINLVINNILKLVNDKTLFDIELKNGSYAALKRAFDNQQLNDSAYSFVKKLVNKRL